MIIRHLTNALELIASGADRMQADMPNAKARATLSKIQGIAEHVLEEYIQPMKDHGTPPFQPDPAAERFMAMIADRAKAV